MGVKKKIRKKEVLFSEIIRLRCAIQVIKFPKIKSKKKKKERKKKQRP